jgi:hypothetical protein
MKFAVLAALMAIAMPAPALAADWVLVDVGSADGTKFYIDRLSMRTMPNGYKRAWNKRDFSKADKDGDTGVKGYDEYDCIEKRSRNISFTFFKGKQPTTTSNEVSKWDYVMPDSTAESLLIFVCRK